MIIQSLPINIGRDADGNDIASTYATKSEIPTKVSDLTNDSGFVNDLSSYYTKSETDTLLGGKSETTHNHDSAYLGITAKAESAKSADSVAWTNVSGKPSTYTPSSHTHDDRYYTESEVDAKLGEKANADHTHSEYLTGITKTMVTTALGYTPPTSDTHWTTTLYAGAKDAKSNAVTTNGNTYIKLYDNNTVRSQLNIKGSGATSVTTDANGVITISSTDNNTTYSNMTAATASAAGTAGLVPAPAAGKQTSFLRGDGTWVVPTNTTYASMSAAEATTGTATAARSISAKVLNDKIDEKISALVASAPETLDTLNELASALGDDPNFATTVATQIGTKANANHNHDSVYVKLTGGTITNNINKVGVGCSWKDGRTNAVIKTDATSSPSNNQYVPCISAKSYQGSWELGTYTNNDYYLTYITDADFDAGTNKATTQYKFCSNGTLIATKFQGALVGNADTATKATNNASGNELSNNIIKGLSVSGKVITYTKLDGTTDTITTQDTNTWTAFKGATSSANGTAGYVPAPTKGNQDKFFKADGTWATPTNTTYSAATQSAEGLMSPADKTKLDGLSNYTLPTASSNLGGVKTTSTVTSTSGLTACPIISGVPYYKDTNTTYSAMSAAEATTGTATTARSITAKVLNDKINEKIATKANSSEVYHYGVCSTAAATAAKVVSITDFVLKTGVTVFVKFTVNNTATNNTLTLNVNSTGAKKIYWRGAQTFSAGYIGGNRVIGFVYDGTNWEIIGELDTSTSVIQTVTTTNATYPILMSDLANATANRTSGVRFGSGVKINPNTNTIYATTFNGDVDFPITEAEIEAIFNGNS